MKFINNVFSDIVHLVSSTLTVSNTVLFDNNYSVQVISIIGVRLYLMLSGNMTLTMSNNKVHSQLIHVHLASNNPYPYCLFQYYTPIHNRL